MCIKCELLDIISKLSKEQNQESALPLKTLSDQLKLIDLEIIDNSLINRNSLLDRLDLGILQWKTIHNKIGIPREKSIKYKSLDRSFQNMFMII